MKKSVFFDSTIYKGLRFQNNKVLDIQSYVKPKTNFQHLHRESAHSPSVLKGFVKSECIRHARKTSDPYIFKTTIHWQANFKTLTQERLLWSGSRPNYYWNRHNKKKNVIVLKSKRRQPNAMIIKTTRIKNLKTHILKHWNGLETNTICREIHLRTSNWLLTVNTKAWAKW